MYFYVLLLAVIVLSGLLIAIGDWLPVVVGWGLTLAHVGVTLSRER